MAYALWERVTLESFFEQNWPHTPVMWENHAFQAPRSSSTWAPSDYVAFLLRSGTGQVISLGSSLLERQASLILVQIFVPELTGKRNSLLYTDYLLDLWIPRDFTDGSNTIRTRAPYAQAMGINAGWYQSNVIVPYILDTPVSNYQS